MPSQDLGEIKKHYEYTDEEDTTEGEEGGAEPDTPEDDAGDEASEACLLYTSPSPRDS